MRTRRDVPLGPMTSIGVGGNASRLIEAATADEVAEAVTDLDASGEAVEILGGGSNVIVEDDGFHGAILLPAIRGIDVTLDHGRATLEVGAGEVWDAVVLQATHEGWRGFECQSGIPGHVGATPIQNVGAYGAEVSETIVAVRAFDRKTRTLIAIAGEDCGFGYRESLFKRTKRYVVTSVVFALEANPMSAPLHYPDLCAALGIAVGSIAPIREVRSAVLDLRRAKGMVVDPNDADSRSAGSFFVNPILASCDLDELDDRLTRANTPLPPRFAVGGRWKVPAAWLIERAGFPRGFTLDRVGISSKHALAITNRGGATAREVWAFASQIQEAVRARFGIDLVPEPVRLGGGGSSVA